MYIVHGMKFTRFSVVDCEKPHELRKKPNSISTTELFNDLVYIGPNIKSDDGGCKAQIKKSTWILIESIMSIIQCWRNEVKTNRLCLGSDINHVFGEGDPFDGKTLFYLPFHLCAALRRCFSRFYIWRNRSRAKTEWSRSVRGNGVRSFYFQAIFGWNELLLEWLCHTFAVRMKLVCAIHLKVKVQLGDSHMAYNIGWEMKSDEGAHWKFP